MTISVLVNTIASAIRTKLSTYLGVAIGSEHCRVMPEGLPIPTMGDWFIAVHPYRFEKRNEDAYCIRGVFITRITMTFRHNSVPYDRLGTDVVARTTPPGMLDIFEATIAGVDGNTSIVSSANTTLLKQGVESPPVVIQPVNFEPKPVRGGGPVGWLNAANLPKAAYILEAGFKSHIQIFR